jgi:outer membrane protein assembly factor BamE (lipoprotein component of BamABCDE complex)
MAGQFVCWMLFLITAGAPCGCTVWIMEAPALPQSSMAAIQPGMTSEQVRGLLGTPKAVDSNEDGSETWIYHRHTWAIFFVHFSQEGVVDETIHDF